MFRISPHLPLILCLAALTSAPAQTRHVPSERATANVDAIARLPRSKAVEGGQAPREVYEPERALRRRHATAARHPPAARADTLATTAPASAGLIVGGFAGLADNFRAIPPDTTGAVGPHDIVTMLNTQMLIQNRTGVARQNYPITLASFWSPLGAFPDAFDPRIQYDAQTDRWIAVSAANSQLASSALLVAVSRTGDPGGVWNYFKLSIGTANQWGDFPVLGFNGNWVVVSVNLFQIRQGSYVKTSLYVFSKADLYQNGAGTALAFDDAVGELTPVQDYDNRTPNTLYLVQAIAGEFSDSPGTGAIRVSKLQGPVGSESFRGGNAGTIVIADPWSDSAPGEADFGPQAGSTSRVDTGDSRLVNCVLRNSSIWCSHTVYLPYGNPTRAAAQWFQFDPATTPPAMLQRGRIEDPTNTHFYAYPSVAVNKNNDVLVAFTRFGANDYPSAAFAFHAASDPANTTQPEVVIKSGESSYVNQGARSGSNRWGDYSATLVDPANDLDFWTIQEYAATPPTSRTGAFGTWWAQVFAPVAGQTCTYALSAGSATFDAAGGTGKLTVSTPAGCAWQATSSVPWIAITSGTAASGTGTVTYSVANTTASRTGTMTIAGLPFAIVQGAPGPTFTAANVVNAASFTAGSLAPGELITIFGTNLGSSDLQVASVSGGQFDTAAGGTRVLFDGVPAPMIYAGERQIAAIVPFAVGARGTTQIQVTYQGVNSAPVTLPVAASAPGIFTTAASGRGQAALLNQDYSINSAETPALRGSSVMIYITGAGAMTQPAIDGRMAAAPLAALLETAAVRIGGIAAPITYAGAAPGLVNGMVQINAVVPDEVTAGASVAVEVTIGGVVSPAGVTLAVR